MLRKRQRKLCYIMICILLMAGLHTTYAKADAFAECAIAEKSVRIQEIQKLDTATPQSPICRVERLNTNLRTVLGQITSRYSFIRRDLKLAGYIFCALCIAAFCLQVWHIEEILYFHEKKYRTALIKYIHDLDGKKRMACLVTNKNKN